MKPIDDGTMDEMESLAMEGAKQLRAFFAYQGSQQTYFQKARVGAMVISAFARLRASETNRLAVELAAKKAAK